MGQEDTSTDADCGGGFGQPRMETHLTTACLVVVLVNDELKVNDKFALYHRLN